MKRAKRCLLSPLSVVIVLLVLSGGKIMTAAEKPAKTPNVLFLFTDDQRADTISALGNPHIQTPNLDRLARSGLVFENAFCMGSNVGAVCRPSRNMLLSGRAYFRFGAYASAEKPNFPSSMNAAGYLTYHHGKIGNTAREIHKKFHFSKYLKDQQERMSGQPGKTIVDDAIAFLKQKKDERPFFMYLAFSTPHDPRVAADQYMQLYGRDKIPLPANYQPVHSFNNGEMTVRDEQLAPWPRSENEIRKHLHDYYAVITGLDGHIGRLLLALKELGQYENTIIIFSSDHGLAIGSHGLMGKQNLYEHSMKAPLVISGPGIPQGKTDALVYLFDIYPTVCDLIGADIPSGLDGQSLLPIIEGNQKRVRDSVLTSYRGVQRAVRNDRWKLIRYPHIAKNQLFDLKTDPNELHNLADDPRQGGRVKEMLALMQQRQKDFGDDSPLTLDKLQNPHFKIPTKKELAAAEKKRQQARKKANRKKRKEG